jgi:hypothetical protein
MVESSDAQSIKGGFGRRQRERILMEEPTQREKDIRKLLKTFGVKSDQLIQEHLQAHPELEKLHLRMVLVDLSEYGDQEPEPRLHLEVEGDIIRE